MGGFTVVQCHISKELLRYIVVYKATGNSFVTE